MRGTFYFLGVGPGDPELLTLKAARILREVALVAYPATGGGTLAHDIAATHIGAQAARLAVPIPMEVERGPAQAAYDDAAAGTIAEYLVAGKSVAWLCEGDPLFYGSAMYLMHRAVEFADIVVVPGVTSITAAAAAIGRPLAARDEMLKVLPATLPDEVLRAELLGASNVAIMKIGRHLDRIRRLLIETGHAESAIIVERATSDRQRITPLLSFDYDDRLYFSVILCYRGDEAWG